MTDYEKEYQRAENVCGEPFGEIAAFFDRYEHPSVDVLDLGCGQGRDALLAARKGHRVTGVDVARSGVLQMIRQAEAEELQVIGVVADIVQFEPSQVYDVVLLDRVLHMLASDDDRRVVLARACDCTREAGYVLVADTPSHLGLIGEFFQGRGGWSTVYRQGGFHFSRREAGKAA